MRRRRRNNARFFPNSRPTSVEPWSPFLNFEAELQIRNRKWKIIFVPVAKKRNEATFFGWKCWTRLKTFTVDVVIIINDESKSVPIFCSYVRASTRCGSDRTLAKMTHKVRLELCCFMIISGGFFCHYIFLSEQFQCKLYNLSPFLRPNWLDKHHKDSINQTSHLPVYPFRPKWHLHL